jgi:hypothetical protein
MISAPVIDLQLIHNRLVDKNIYSDLTIICGGDRYPVHRVTVCTRATWFEEECKRLSQAQTVRKTYDLSIAFE